MIKEPVILQNIISRLDMVKYWEKGKAKYPDIAILDDKLYMLDPELDAYCHFYGNVKATYAEIERRNGNAT